jgi:hypothetical protein
MKPEEFERQLGPFVLVQRPPDVVAQQKALQLGAKRTVALTRNATAADALSLLFEFDDLLVATLPEVPPEGLTVGRLPDCDLVVDDPSVSKHHARLTWDELLKGALVEDLGSSNGTLHNGAEVHGTVTMHDGDEISFGDARYCYMRSRTLHSRLTTGRFKRA